jgi:hypothetical protein
LRNDKGAAGNYLFPGSPVVHLPKGRADQRFFPLKGEPVFLNPLQPRIIMAMQPTVDKFPSALGGCQPVFALKLGHELRGMTRVLKKIEKYPQ